MKALLIHYSTDYVFDGTKETPYTENDEPKPINIYGTTKLAGEQAIQAIAADHRRPDRLPHLGKTHRRDNRSHHETITR